MEFIRNERCHRSVVSLSFFFGIESTFLPGSCDKVLFIHECANGKLARLCWISVSQQKRRLLFIRVRLFTKSPSRKSPYYCHGKVYELVSEVDFFLEYCF